MKKYLKMTNITFWVLISSIMMFAIYKHSKDNNIYRIKISDININGQNLISKDEIIELINIQIHNKNILTLNISEIEQKILKSFFVEDVQVITKIPNYIEIKIDEIELIASVQNKENEINYINENYIIKKSHLADSIFNNKVKKYEPIKINYDSMNYSDSYENEISMLNLFQKNTPILFNEIHEIKSYDDSIFVIFNNKARIKLKNSNNHRINIKKIIAFIEQGLNEDRKLFSINKFDLENINLYAYKRLGCTSRKEKSQL